MGNMLALNVNISAVITFVALGIFFLSMLYGFKRGVIKSSIRIITVLASAIVAYFTASGVSGAITSRLSDKTLPDLWNSLASAVPAIDSYMSEETLALLGEFDPETSTHIIALFVSLVIIPIVFVAVFFILKLLTMIIHWLLVAMLGFSKRRTKLWSRFAGMGVGLVQGMMIVFVLILPIAGFSVVADECRTVLTSDEVSESTREDAEKFFSSYVDSTIDNPIIKTVNSVGGNALFDDMTAMTFGEDKISTEEELVTFIRIFTKAEHLKGIDWNYPTKEQETAIQDIIDLIGDDYYTATVISGVLRGFSRAVSDGVMDLDLKEPMNTFVTSIVTVFSDSSRANLGGDLNTVIHIYFILADNHVIANFYEDDDLRDCLLAPHEDGKNVIDYVVDELYLNPRTAGIVNALTEISVKIMCEDLNLEDDAKQIYENVKTDVTDILNMNESDFSSPEKYREAVSTELKETLDNNNITLDENIVESMSEFIAENYNETSGEITDEDINKAILSYYKSYAEENPDAGLPDELPDDLPDNIEDILGGLGGNN